MIHGPGFTTLNGVGALGLDALPMTRGTSHVGQCHSPSSRQGYASAEEHDSTQPCRPAKSLVRVGHQTEPVPKIPPVQAGLLHTARTIPREMMHLHHPYHTAASR